MSKKKRRLKQLEPAALPVSSKMARVAGAAGMAWVLAAALIIRLIFVFQSRQSPFFDPSLLDAKYYHEWALGILRGESPPPVFYGLPLYPYFLACLHGILGSDVLGAKIAQACLGLVTVFFTAKSAEKLFEKRTGFAAAVLAAFYAPLFFHETLIIPEALGVPLYAASFYTGLLFLEKPTFLTASRAGALIGLASLTKAGALLFVPLGLFYFLKTSVDAKKIPNAICLAASCALVLAPVTLHNTVRGHDFVWLTSHSGFNFYAGNHPGAEGVFSPPEGTGTNIEAQILDSRQIAEKEAGRSLKPSEVSRYWADKAWVFIRENPGAFIRLSARKILLFFDSREISDVEDYQFSKTFIPFLNFPWPSFSWLGPLFAAGLVLGWKRMKHRTPTLLWIGAYLTGLIFFFVNARYRLPMLPVFIAVAAFGVTRLFEVVSKLELRSLVFAGAASAIAFWVGHLGLVNTSFVRDYVNAGDVWLEKSDLEKAESFYRKALEADPGYAKAHLAMALVNTKRGRHEEAKVFYEKTLSIDPGNAQALNNLGMWYERAGDGAAAEKLFLEAIERHPGSSQARNNLGMVYAKTGRAGEAIEQFEKSLAINPKSPRALTNLGLVLYRDGQVSRAKELWRKALEMDPGFQEAAKALRALDSFDSR